jgi:hypothetical protein
MNWIKTCLYSFCVVSASALTAQNLINNQFSVGTYGATFGSSVFFDSENNYYMLKSLQISNPDINMGNIVADIYGEAFMVLSKFDINHNLLWSVSYGGDSTETGGFAISQNDGLIIFTRSNSPVSGNKNVEGNGFQHIWYFKVDFNGTILWQNTIEAHDNILFPIIHELQNGNILVSTTSMVGIGGDKTDYGFDNSDAWLILLDSDGEILWDKAIGTNDWDGFFNIIGQFSNGDVVLSSLSYADASGSKTENAYSEFGDSWFVCINSLNGDIVWDRTVGGSSMDFPNGGAIINNEVWQNIGSSSGISGIRTSPLKGVRDNWIVSLNQNGDVIRQFSIGGDGDDFNGRFFDFNNEQLYLITTSNSPVSIDKNEENRGGLDLWIVRVDFDGNILTQKTIGGNNNDLIGSVSILPNGNYLIVSNSQSGISGEKTVPRIGPNSTDVWVLEIDAVTLNIVNQQPLGKSTTLYPNPTSSQINVSFSEATQLNKAILYDVSGKIVLEQAFENNFESVYAINVSGLASGVYTLRLEGPGVVITRQVVVE